MKNSILINMGTIKKGGGQNVALNFIYSLSYIPNLPKLIFAVVKNSECHFALINSGFTDLIFVPKNPYIRVIFEFFYLSFIILKRKINLVYTYFGYTLFIGNTKQVIGSADSNIYFPEIKFWNENNLLSKFKRWLVDSYRIFGIKHAQYVIYENKSMLQRAKVLFNVNESIYIAPSVLTTSTCNIESPKTNHGLFFCGWQENKNYKLIPYILAESTQDVERELIINFTVSESKSNLCDEFINKCKQLGVIDRVKFVGVIRKENIMALYNGVKYVFLLSQLESFSNNIAEAWFYKRVLIVTNSEWSRQICGDAAVYVDRSSPSEIVAAMRYADENYNLLVSNGLRKLKELNSPAEKALKEIDYLRDILR